MPEPQCALPISAPAARLYLPAAEGGGSPWCFAPDSTALRTYLRADAPAADATVDAQALLQDLDFLREVMRLQYSGYGELVQHRSFDVDAHFADWRRKLTGAGACISFEEGVLAPLRQMRAAVVDMHHSVAGWGPKLRAESTSRIREFQAAVSNAPELSSCLIEGGAAPFPATFRIAPLLGNAEAKALLTASARGDGDLKARCGDRTIELAPRRELPRREPPGPDEELYAFRRVGDTAVITVRRLGGTSAQVAQLEQLVKDASAHKKAQRIVFDFRHNGGGNDGYIYEWISQVKNGVWDSGAAYNLVGGLHPCFLWNAHVHMQIRDGSVDAPAAKAARQKLRAQWPAAPGPIRWQYNSGVIHERAAEPFTGRVYALVDRYSGSSGESGPWALKNALGATLLGERTAGVLEYGNQASYVLPRTGIVWQLPTKKNLFEVQVEGVGLPVDFYLEDPAAPVEDILPLLP